MSRRAPDAAHARRFASGRDAHADALLGAHPRTVDGVAGVEFVVWAPAARAVHVVGDWSGWDASAHPLRRVGAAGLWSGFVPGVAEGARYQFELLASDGTTHRKSDPFATRAALRPERASLVFASHHRWHDADWIASRASRHADDAPMSIYELHAGSWRRRGSPDGPWLSWRELAPLVADHVAALGFTHVELMPVAEHPLDASWGYQVTGHFAPTARHGDPDGLRAFVDHLHARGLGVIVDWVPAHFPRDDFALARFDGTALFEHADPRAGEHPDWGTLVFDLARPGVRSFLRSSAAAWVRGFHVDGLRVDAVASMLYRDYSRRGGAWLPNAQGGREHLEAVSFFQELGAYLRAEHPGVALIAEESTAWPGVTHPPDRGGLGFSLKWNMGWMHDTLAYFARDPIERKHHHHALTFGLTYAFGERYVLPLSHDEVVHGKGSLLARMHGDRAQRFAHLRALYGWMWCHPGRKLLFMGGELADPREWSEARGLEWSLLDDPMHAGVAALVGALNRLYRATPALWRDEPAGFVWVEADDAERSVYAFVREGRAGDATALCVLNATPVAREAYRVGVPRPGRWMTALDTDAAAFGGSGGGSGGELGSEPVPCHGREHSLVLRLAPLSVRVLTLAGRRGALDDGSQEGLQLGAHGRPGDGRSSGPAASGRDRRDHEEECR